MLGVQGAQDAQGSSAVRHVLGRRAGLASDADRQGAVRFELHLDIVIRRQRGFFRIGQVDHVRRVGLGHGHEDNQQNQHHVDVRHDIDFRLEFAAPAASHAAVERSHLAPVQRDWRCRMFENSSTKLSKRVARRSMSWVKRLYATTAGIAANRPMAVAISASAMPGATTASVACWTLARPRKAFMMPQTVPSRPMYGETEPTEARKARCDSSTSISRWKAARMARRAPSSTAPTSSASREP